MINRTYAILALAALAFAGCSKVEEFSGNPDSALTIESVSGISPFALMQEPASKAVISGETLPSEEAGKGIGLFVTASDGGAYDGKDSGYTNVKYSFNGTKWSAVSPIYLSHSTGKLYGYFPYSETATDLTKIPVASSLNGTDYLYATSQEVSYSNKSVDLTMSHALARLHLTIKKGDTYLSGGNLTKIAIQSKAIDSYGTMDITTGAVAGLKDEGATGSVIFEGDGVTGIVSKIGVEKDILLVPADNSEGKKDLTLILTIDGVEAKVIFTGDKGLDIRSGVQSRATLVIEDSGIKVTGVGVGVWGDGGSQTVQVGGHTVTVKLADDEGISDDLIVQVALNGSSVYVKTYSDSGKKLVIRNDDATLVTPVEDGNKSIFTISDITSDITATLAYAKTRTVSVNVAGVDKAPNVSGYVYGKAEPITEIEGRPSILTAIPGEGYAVDYFNVKGTRYGDKAEVLIPSDVETIDAYFRFSDWLGGVFTVADDGKGNVRKVRFSRGNLWCKGKDSDEFPAIESWGFETSQYITQSNRTIDHISHFMWCKSASESVKLKYAEPEPTGSDNLFTNASPTEPNGNFAVNSQKGFWRALSGGSNGEWKFLIDRKDSEGNALCKYGVKVCGSENCLILLPDDWKWGENGVGTVWQNEYSESTTIKWSTMEAAGAVCLPAAGFRFGNDSDTPVGSVGYGGSYWSSTPSDSNNAYRLDFNSGSVNPANSYFRFSAYAVRLVTESKSLKAITPRHRRGRI